MRTADDYRRKVKDYLARIEVIHAWQRGELAEMPEYAEDMKAETAYTLLADFAEMAADDLEAYGNPTVH